MSAKRNYAEMYTYDMKEGDKPLKVSTEFQGNCKSVNEYRKEFRIGEGTYGIVYRATKPGTEEPVALKRIRMDHDSDGFPVSALREISILRNLKHENIVTVTDVVVANGLENVFMAMEYCEQDMAYLMDNVMSKDSSKAYSAAQVKCLQRQLLLGIEYLHDNFIIHRDLKLSNLLLNRKGSLKIADFGLARTFSDPPDPMTPKVVTLWYRSPELLFGTSEYNTSIDIWSAGCIFGEFLISTPLLPGKTERDQLVLICELLGSPNTKIWPEIRKMPLYDELRLPEIPYDSINSVFKNTSSATVSLLKGMLVYRPQERLSARKALQHRYFDERPLACNPAMLPTYPELRNKRKT